MYVKVDWYSCTYKRHQELGDQTEDVARGALDSLTAVAGKAVGESLSQFAWERMPGRKRFSWSVGIPDEGVRIYSNHDLDYYLLEISGKGCDLLRSLDTLNTLIESTSERASRLDMACDMVEDVTPDEFVKSGYSGRYGESPRIPSKDGITRYVGSWKSDRFARVYRYNEPHPRAGITRVELVYRRGMAKAALEQLSLNDLPNMIASMSAPFSFKHPAWNVETSEATPLNLATPDRTTGGTEKWLVSQAAPAFRRLVSEGVIKDPQKWLETWFLADVDDEP